ncbi:unnamed protein product, partial [Toxocara canis]|uniref:tRNA N(3)-methylcytidine methyltransferase n=1 Tax=Toxocara canis TaxID=6265 RepID=A0A183UJN4_TOXCA
SELEKLQREKPANEFKRKKLELEAQKNWDKFYKRNKDKFFKDRHWSREDLVSLCAHINLKDHLTYLDAGCGVGNMLFPLIDYFPSWSFFGFDFSSNAIQLLNERAQSTQTSVSSCVADLCDSQHFPPPMLYSNGSPNMSIGVASSSTYDRISLQRPECPNAINHDAVPALEGSSSENSDGSCSAALDYQTSNGLYCVDSECNDGVGNRPDNSISFAATIPPNIDPHKVRHVSQRNGSSALNGSKSIGFQGADLTTLIFVLSAIHPEKHAIAIRNLTKVVKKGGTVIVRDYGVNDHAMIRFGRGAKLSDRFYARQDGTRAFYFQLEELEQLFLAEGYSVKRSEYLFRKTVNHEKNLAVDRVFVQAVFVRIR